MEAGLATARRLNELADELADELRGADSSGPLGLAVAYLYSLATIVEHASEPAAMMALSKGLNILGSAARGLLQLDLEREQDLQRNRGKT